MNLNSPFAFLSNGLELIEYYGTFESFYGKSLGQKIIPLIQTCWNNKKRSIFLFYHGKLRISRQTTTNLNWKQQKGLLWIIHLIDKGFDKQHYDLQRQTERSKNILKIHWNRKWNVLTNKHRSKNCEFLQHEKRTKTRSENSRKFLFWS